MQVSLFYSCQFTSWFLCSTIQFSNMLNSRQCSEAANTWSQRIHCQKHPVQSDGFHHPSHGESWQRHGRYPTTRQRSDGRLSYWQHRADACSWPCWYAQSSLHQDGWVPWKLQAKRSDQKLLHFHCTLWSVGGQPKFRYSVTAELPQTDISHTQSPLISRQKPQSLLL